MKILIISLALLDSMTVFGNSKGDYTTFFECFIIFVLGMCFEEKRGAL